MITVHAGDIRYWQDIIDHCPPAMIEVGVYVDDVFAVLYPPTGHGMCPVVTFQGSKAAAEQALEPIAAALRRGNARAALDAATKTY